MIVSIPVDIKRLVELKKNYPWSKPDHCSIRKSISSHAITGKYITGVTYQHQYR